PLPITPSLPKVTQKSEVDKAEIAPPIPKIEQEKKEDRISGTPSAPKITHDTTQKGIKEFYVVQVASCKSEKKAYDISNRLKKKGYPSYVMQVEIKDKGTYHRILIGNYDNKENAKKMMHQLKQDEQFSPIITRIKQ
ncbi:MAG: SPOR domain-containing protein, partial [Thermodesulfobacteriota bacterium]|nr:SPOR domain-containing protein [Thermodesulfobacteriota bacterium]